MATHHSTEELLTAIERFSDYCYAQLGYADSTVVLATGFVRRFAGSIGLNPTHEEVERYIADLRRAGKTNSYVATAANAIEHYMRMRGNPIRLGRPKKDKQLPINVLSEAEVAVLIASAKTLRERALLAVLAYSGARNREICSLRVRHIDIGQQTVTIEKGKNSRSRKVCLSGDCVDILVQYLAQRAGGPDDYLFVTVRHRHKLATQDLRKILRVIAARAGAQKRVHPHLLRHTLATAMLHRGASILAIKEQLGHEYIQSTMLYMHASAERLQRDYRQFCPSYM